MDARLNKPFEQQSDNRANHDADKHLSLLGIGPVYVGLICILTVVGIYLTYSEIWFLPYAPSVDIFAKICGLLLCFLGFDLFMSASVRSNIRTNIKENRLVTTGVYAVVRNPIYSAWMLLCWGILFCTGNVYMLVSIPLFWALMTLVLITTEERWLIDFYGQPYVDYCKKVNRCIPWPPKSYEHEEFTDF